MGGMIGTGMTTQRSAMAGFARGSIEEQQRDTMKKQEDAAERQRIASMSGAAGALIGGIIGSFVPVVGNAVGAAIGGAVGSGAAYAGTS